MYNDVYSISDGPRVNKKAHLISLKAVINNPILGFVGKWLALTQIWPPLNQ